MVKRNESHEIVMESLAIAIVQLIKKKPINEITVSELCNRAGVGRCSFYRNFDSIQGVLVYYLKKLTDEWWIDYLKRNEANGSLVNFWEELLEQYKKSEELIKILYTNNCSYLIKDHIFECCNPENGKDSDESYKIAILAGAIYGLVDRWIREGMKDVPKNLNIKQMIKSIENQ